MNRAFTCIAALIVLFSAGAKLSATDCGRSALPHEVAAKLAADYPAWQIVSEQQMDVEDAASWRENHPDWCPGSVQGQFVDGASKGWVLALFRGAATAYTETVVLFETDASGVVHETVLSTPAPTRGIWVISKAGPGVFHDSEHTQSVTVTTEAVVFELPESTAVLLYLQAGKVHRLAVSE